MPRLVIKDAQESDQRLVIAGKLFIIFVCCGSLARGGNVRVDSHAGQGPSIKVEPAAPTT
jgi:hypothetical protein